METRTYRVRGRVQGVGFRRWTERAALELGLVGDVRNLPDGTVEVRAAGAAPALEALERRLNEGPPAARVESMEVDVGAERGSGWSGFGIIRG